MRLAASAMPPRSSRAFDGRVHSVFRRVVNVRLDGGELLTVYAGVAESEPPGAITIAAPVDFDFAEYVAHRAAVSCRGGVLRVEGSDVSVDLRQARLRDARPLAASRKETRNDFHARWHTAWQTLLGAGVTGLVVALQGRRAAGSLDAALADRARQAVPQLLAAARTSDIEGALIAAARLIGAGPGLTPSGDDFLAGFLVAMRQAGQDRAQLDFTERFGRRLVILYGAGGDIPRNYIIHAAAGRIARPLAKLAESITGGAREIDIKTATVAALQIGHSSGADATFGLLCGLAAWRVDVAAVMAAALAGTVSQR